jgi:hypothetical protein
MRNLIIGKKHLPDFESIAQHLVQQHCLQRFPFWQFVNGVRHVPK